MRWFREHKMAMGAALSRIAHAPAGFAFNVVVIALALSLPLAGLGLLENLRPVSRELAVDPEISVFLTNTVTTEQAQDVAGEMRLLAQSTGLEVKLEFIGRAQALESMKARAGLTDVVAALGSNPLPDAYIVRVADGSSAHNAERIENFAAEMQKLKHVDTVQLDAVWVKRLGALLQLAATALSLLAVSLCGVVLAVVFNTIRLQLVTQHEEISVARLLGATDAFVARPYYYMGALLGLCAGVLALLAVLASMALLNQPVAQLAHLYGSDFHLVALNAPISAGLLSMSLALGVSGAALSVRAALRRAN